MLAEQFTTAATTARTIAHIDEIARLTWRAHAEGLLPDAAAQAVAEALQARRAHIGGKGSSTPSKPLMARRRPVSPDKAASLARRRRLAASGAVPSRLAASFTTAELSALTVIAREVQRRGRCELHIDAIAAMGGTCRTVVQNALRVAAAMGLLRVTERRRPGQRSLSNVVEVISPEWRDWLRLGGWVQKGKPLEYMSKSSGPFFGCSAIHGIVAPRKDRICTNRSKPPSKPLPSKR